MMMDDLLHCSTSNDCIFPLLNAWHHQPTTQRVTQCRATNTPKRNDIAHTFAGQKRDAMQQRYRPHCGSEQLPTVLLVIVTVTVTNLSNRCILPSVFEDWYLTTTTTATMEAVRMSMVKATVDGEAIATTTSTGHG